jgi:putative SOS response-associated peptidase YedK
LTEDEIIEVREILREWSLKIVKDDFTEHAQLRERDIQPPYSGTARVFAEAGAFGSSGEVRPTNLSPVLLKPGPQTASDEVSFENLKWGFRKWDGKGVIINARAETLQSKRQFAPLLKTGRCVVPASEYYEWNRQDKAKKKHFVKDAEGNILFMAGLYQDGADGREFVIITKDAYGDVTQIHNRMPVLLRAGQIEEWLNGKLTPEAIVRLDFNVSVTPCKGAEASGSEVEQLSLE